MPYQSRHADVIARMMHDRGRAAADADYRRSALRGQTIAQIGQLASGTLRDLAQYKLEAPERERRAKLLAREDQRFADEDADRGRANAVRDAERMVPVDAATGRPNAAAVAKEVQLIDPERARAWWQQASAEEKAQADKDHARATKLATTAGAILGLPAEKRPEAWVIARKDLLTEWQPEDIPDAYDETWVTTKFNEAKTIAQQIEALKPKEVKTREITWNKPDGTVVKEVIADEVGATRESAPAPPGNIDTALYNAWRTGNTVQYRQLLRVKAEMTSAGRAPDDGGDDTRITPTMRATAERWRADQLNALEDRRRKSTSGGFNQVTGEPNPPMSTAEYQAAKERIESAYRESLGIPAPGPQMAAPLPAPPTSVRPNPIPLPGDGAAPPTPPAAPAAPATATAPAFKVTPNANGTVTVVAPDGVTKATFPNQAAADAAIAEAQGMTARP